MRFASLVALLTLAAGASLIRPAASAATLDERRQAIQQRLEALRGGAGEDAATALRELIEVYFDHTVLEHPEFATSIGHPGENDRWTDRSPEALARRDETTRGFLEAVRGIDRSALTAADRLDHALLEAKFEEQVEEQRFPEEELAISQMGGPQQTVPRVIALMPVRSASDYEAVLARLAAVPVLVEQTIALLGKGIESGVTPPAVTLREVPQQVENLLVAEALDSPMLEAFKEFPDNIPTEVAIRLRDRAIQTWEHKVAPAFRRLRGFLTESYLPAARVSIAMSDLPDGEAWYAFRVRRMTTTRLTPEEIHRLGLSEVARIRRQMDTVIADTGFEGDFTRFLEFLRTDPRFYFERPEDLLREYRDIAKRADPELVKLFGHLPRLPYGVIPVPDYAERSQTTAYYERGSLAAGRPGYFFANTYDLASRPKWEMEALTLHEAVPGHHLQLAIQQELEELPWFRRFGGYTAYTEGWGLYAESLGEEMGFYLDPYSRFGQLTYEMWRAVRLVVDTGIHALGWTRQQAIDYFAANAGKTEHDIEVEVDRYIVWPAQALAYKIGELKIKELRAHARRELDEGFDLRAFHDELLGSGALPLDILERRMGDWVAERKAEAERLAAAAQVGEGPEEPKRRRGWFGRRKAAADSGDGRDLG